MLVLNVTQKICFSNNFLHYLLNVFHTIFFYCYLVNRKIYLLTKLVVRKNKYLVLK